MSKAVHEYFAWRVRVARWGSAIRPSREPVGMGHLPRECSDRISRRLGEVRGESKARPLDVSATPRTHALSPKLNRGREELARAASILIPLPQQQMQSLEPEGSY